LNEPGGHQTGLKKDQVKLVFFMQASVFLQKAAPVGGPGTTRRGGDKDEQRGG